MAKYPDEVTYNLVAATSEALGLSADTLLEQFRNECAVYLEPEVLRVLTEFYKRCSQPENN